jgi:hypothetical protein
MLMRNELEHLKRSVSLCGKLGLQGLEGPLKKIYLPEDKLMIILFNEYNLLSLI